MRSGNARINVALTPGNQVEYITDSFGARVGTANTTLAPELLIVGDSQALGYNLLFQQTAAARIGDCVSAGGTAISAAPASDLEDYLLRMELEVKKRNGLRRIILFLNLGNDLDEVYSTGQWLRGTSTKRLPKWLLENSRFYQKALLFMQEEELRENSVPGVNRILYELSADERVVLTDSFATRLVNGLNALPLKHVLVVIIPSDVDVDQDELKKYAVYSTDDAFSSWLERSEVFSNQLAAIRRLLISRLQSAEVDVIDLHNKFVALGASSVYARTSHHLTATSNELAAESICSHLRSSL